VTAFFPLFMVIIVSDIYYLFFVSVSFHQISNIGIKYYIFGMNMQLNGFFLFLFQAFFSIGVLSLCFSVCILFTEPRLAHLAIEHLQMDNRSPDSRGSHLGPRSRRTPLGSLQRRLASRRPARRPSTRRAAIRDRMRLFRHLDLVPHCWASSLPSVGLFALNLTQNSRSRVRSHLIIYLMKVDLAHFIYDVLAFKRNKTKASMSICLFVEH